MSKRKGFTLIELLVVIAIIALLMSIMMPALSRVKNQAKTIGCRANLKQWGMFFSMYTQENNGYFQAGTGDGHRNHWMNALRSLYKNDHKVMCCPTALKPIVDEFGVIAPEWNVFSAWGRYTLDRDGAGYAPGPQGDWGSFGINGWAENPPASLLTVFEGFETKNQWRTPNVARASYVPLMMDALRFNVFPLSTDNPPMSEDQVWESTQHIRRICINRHEGAINMVFLDWSVRKVDLKELWTLKWHKTFNTGGPWTRAGGVIPSDWPDWMQSLPEY